MSTQQLLAFEVSASRFALPAGLVREVVRAVAIAALPKAPPIVEGIINFRGTLVPVLDIRRRFGMSPVPLAPEQHLILADSGRRVVALRVDRAVDLVTVNADAVESVARLAPGTQYVTGIAKMTDGLLVIHDLASFLSLDEAQKVDDAVVEAMASEEPAPRLKGGR